MSRSLEHCESVHREVVPFELSILQCKNETLPERKRYNVRKKKKAKSEGNDMLVTLSIRLQISDIVERVFGLFSRIEHVRCLAFDDRMFSAESNELIQHMGRRLACTCHQINACTGEQRGAEHRRHPLIRLIGKRFIIDEDKTEVAGE